MLLNLVALGAVLFSGAVNASVQIVYSPNPDADERDPDQIRFPAVLGRLPQTASISKLMELA